MLDNFNDISQLADKLKYYQGAESIAIHVVSSIGNGMLSLAHMILAAASYIALSWHTLSFRVDRIIQWFATLILVMVLLFPVNVESPVGLGTIKVPASLYHFNRATTALVTMAQDVLDKSIGKQNGTVPGNFAAPTAALSPMAMSYVTPVISDAHLPRIHAKYINECSDPLLASDAVKKSGDLANAITYTFLPNKGVLGRGTKAGDLGEWAPLHNNLVTLPGTLKEVLEKQLLTLDLDDIHEIKIETDDSLLARLRNSDKKIDAAYMENSYPELRYKTPDGNENSVDQSTGVQTTSFYPTNCYELYQILDLSFRQYFRAVASQGHLTASQATDRWLSVKAPTLVSEIYKGAMAGISAVFSNTGTLDTILTGSKSCSTTLASRVAIEKAFTEYVNDAMPDKGAIKAAQTGGMGGAFGNTFGRKAASPAVSVLSEGYKWFTEVGVIIATAIIPSAAALFIAGIFILFGPALAFSLLPNRESSIWTIVHAIVFVKLTVLCSYIILNVGGYFGTGAVCIMMESKSSLGDAVSLTGPLRGFAIATLILTYIGAVFGAPWLAYIITFNDRGGLASMGFNRFGLRQMAQTAAVMTSLIRGSVRTPGGGGGGGGSSGGGSGGGGSGTAPRGVPPSGVRSSARHGDGYRAQHATDAFLRQRFKKNGGNKPPRVG